MCYPLTPYCIHLPLGMQLPYCILVDGNISICWMLRTQKTKTTRYIDLETSYQVLKMSSPLLNMICCEVRKGNKNETHSHHSKNSHHPEKNVMLIFGFIFFTGMFVGALVSLIGTGLTLRPKRGTQRTRREAVADKRQRVILSWLAASDLLGCVGKLKRIWTVQFYVHCIPNVQIVQSKSYHNSATSYNLQNNLNGSQDIYLTIVFVIGSPVYDKVNELGPVS